MSQDVRGVLATTRRARLLVRLAAVVLVGGFGWLQYKNAPIAEALSGASPELLLRLSLLLYFICWVYGANVDTDEQELAYQAGLDSKFPRGGYLSAVAIALVFAALCLIRSPGAFAVLLLCFLAINVITWRYLVTRIVSRAAEASEAAYVGQGEHGSQIILRQFVGYIGGSWQWWRFVYGGVLCLAMVWVAFGNPPVRFPSYLNRDLLLSLLLVFYVITFEGWIWYMRLRLRLKRETIEDIEKSHMIVMG